MSRFIDLTGQRFGRLTVVRESERANDGRRTWLCRCDCGKEKSIRTENLTSGRTKSCGCSKIINIKGKRFGRLVALEMVEIDKFHRAIWKCKCDCGNEYNVAYSALKSGNTSSCGCLHDELFEKNRQKLYKHGMAKSGERNRLYTIWEGMKQRCYNEKHPKYHRYGGRGITVCDEWLHNSQAFVDWSMAHGYADNLSIDRINNDGNYEPSNCRWSTNKEQSNNVSYNILFEMNGKKQTLKQWAEEVGINYGTLYGRIHRNGWSFEKAISTKGDARYKDEGHTLF